MFLLLFKIHTQECTCNKSATNIEFSLLDWIYFEMNRGTPIDQQSKSIGVEQKKMSGKKWEGMKCMYGCMGVLRDFVLGFLLLSGCSVFIIVTRTTFFEFIILWHLIYSALMML